MEKLLYAELNIICIVVCLLMLRNILSRHDKSGSWEQRFFTMLICANIVILLTDTANWVLAGVTTDFAFLLNYVWNKCYRTSFIMQYDLKFDEARQTWEDGLFIINCLKNATSVLLISDVLHCGCADPTVEHLSGNLYDTQLSMYISDETNYKQWFEQRYNFNSQHYARSNFNVINMLCSQTVKRYGKKARGILNDAVKAPIVKFWIHNVVPKDKTEEKIISAIAREDADRLYRLYSITLPRRVLRKLKSIF